MTFSADATGSATTRRFAGLQGEEPRGLLTPEQIKERDLTTGVERIWKGLPLIAKVSGMLQLARFATDARKEYAAEVSERLGDAEHILDAAEQEYRIPSAGMMRCSEYRDRTAAHGFDVQNIDILLQQLQRATARRGESAKQRKDARQRSKYAKDHAAKDHAAKDHAAKDHAAKDHAAKDHAELRGACALFLKELRRYHREIITAKHAIRQQEAEDAAWGAWAGRYSSRQPSEPEIQLLDGLENALTEGLRRTYELRVRLWEGRLALVRGMPEYAAAVQDLASDDPEKQLAAELRILELEDIVTTMDGKYLLSSDDSEREVWDRTMDFLPAAPSEADARIVYCPKWSEFLHWVAAMPECVLDCGSPHVAHLVYHLTEDPGTFPTIAFSQEEPVITLLPEALRHWFPDCVAIADQYAANLRRAVAISRSLDEAEKNEELRR